MERVYEALLGISLVVNGAMGGLIAGYILTKPTECQCEGCDCRKPRRDVGPFPTGWVVPDGLPQPKPKPNGAMP